jgi:hypothetical protein
VRDRLPIAGLERQEAFMPHGSLPRVVRRGWALAIPLSLMLSAALRAAAAPDAHSVLAALDTSDADALRVHGPTVMPVLARLYREGDAKRRTAIALTWYRLGWKSEEAREALMQDLHTSEVALRLQVQWALGRVSNDDVVVAELLRNMRNDPNPLFRDKSACALAFDQIHLTPSQKAALYAGLIDALTDDKLDVRRIALLALQHHTGQTRGFNPVAASETRAHQVLVWRRWLTEFRNEL